MPVVLVGKSSNSTSERIKLRPRIEMNHHHHQEEEEDSFESTRSKLIPKKKLNKNKKFMGFGCKASASSEQVCLPTVIRSSADWDDANRVKKKKQKNGNSNKKKNSNSKDNEVMMNMCSGNGNNNNLSSCGVGQDVWCGPGIGFSSSDAVVGSAVDCVVTTRRNVVSGGRGKIDNHQRERERERERDRDRDKERSSCLARRTVNPEFPFPDFDAPFAPARPELDVFGPRYYRHLRHPSPDGLAEIMMLQNSLLMGGRADSHDRFRDWRLDVDDMSYEELLELGDRIGYVNTGLEEEEIGQCLSNLKKSIINDLSSHLPMHIDNKCTICQEEYEAGDELGKLDCGHGFHIQCIKQWLSQKNACPICKAAVVNRC